MIPHPKRHLDKKTDTGHLRWVCLRTLSIFVSTLLCLAAFPGEVVSQTNVGATAAQFLKIDVGPRAVAMGGNFVAQADDATTLYWNPAGAAIITERMLTFTHTLWFADITHDYFGMVVPWSQGAIGLSIISLNTGAMEQTTLEKPEGTGNFFDFSDLSLGLTFSRPLTDRFSVGITGKYINENLYNESASTFAIDLGTLLDLGYKGMRIGMSISNFGGRMKLNGRDLTQREDLNNDGEYETESNLSTQDWALPLTFRVGTVINIIGPGSGLWLHPDNRITLEVDGIHPNDNDERMGVGTEYSWKEILFLRGGYKLNHDVESFSWGGGFKITTDMFGVGVDYAYADLGDLDQVQRFSVSINF